MGPKIGPVLYNVLDSHNPSHEQTSFLFGWFGSRAKHADLMPESIIKRLHPDIQAEFAKKPKLRRGFAKEMQMSLKHSQAHGEEAVEEFRTLLNDNIQELNRVVDEEGPEHLQQLLKHAEMTMSEHQQATPWQMAQRLGLAMAPVVLLPVSSQVRVRCANGPSDLRDFLWDCPKKRKRNNWNMQREPTASWNNGTMERDCGCCYHFWGTCFMNGTSPCMAVHPKSLRQVKGCVGFRVGPGLRLDRDWGWWRPGEYTQWAALRWQVWWLDVSNS